MDGGRRRNAGTGNHRVASLVDANVSIALVIFLDLFYISYMFTISVFLGKLCRFNYLLLGHLKVDTWKVWILDRK